MADYKELLRRAVEALPENNGAARRAVYEKARAALVGQLRAINPPLAARDITTHRLQLEDCIRQVEQEASEAVIAGMSGGHHADSALPPPVYFEVPVQNRQLPSPGPAKAQPQPVARAAPREPVRESNKTQQPGASIEDIIAAADSDARAQSEQRGRNGSARPEPKSNGSKPIQLRAVPPEPIREPEPEDDEPAPVEEKLPTRPAGRPGGRPLPSIVARAEAAKNRSASTAFGVPADKPYDSGRRGPTLEARPQNSGPRLEPRGQQQAVARQQIAAPITYIEQPQIGTAMSAVREVDVEPEAHPADPQGLIDRAMATLDREARGEPVNSNGYDTGDEEEDEIPAPAPVKAKGLVGGMFPDAPRRSESFERSGRQPKPQREARQPKPTRETKARRGRESSRESAFPESGFPRARAEDDRGGISAVTIFLIVFAVLLLGAGGAGVWAWNERYIDLDTILGGKPAVVAGATPTAAQPTMATVAEPQSGVGNSTTTAEPMAVVPELKQDERLTADTAAVATETPALGIAPVAAAPTAERLGTDTAAGAIGTATDTATLNPEGSQSLLLEASDDGKTGAVPFSGTVEWSKGKDETGLPTLIGKASIPARNLGVDVLIRKNVDPSLPASHLMEINFRVSDSFIGGSVAGLPGVLLKNEELVQGAPLVGASARVVGNSFLFALSASPEDTAANNQLLTSRKWIDLAIIYATGKRAIITLEKDSAAEAMFTEVFTAWGATAAANPQ